MVYYDVDISAIGSVTWDRYLALPRRPTPNSRLRAIAAYESVGGSAASSLIPLARWGMRCRAVGWVGADEAGRRAVGELESEGIHVDSIVVRSNASTKRNTILVDHVDGSNTVIEEPARVETLEADDLPFESVKKSRVLHVDASESYCSAAACWLAHRSRVKVVLNADKPMSKGAEVLKMADIVIATRHFAERTTGEARADLAAYALSLSISKPVIVLNGPGGCEYLGVDDSIHQPAFPTEVVDPSHASDAFRAGFIYGMLAGWDLRKVLKIACWVASAACREIGLARSIPAEGELTRFCRQDGRR